MTYRYGKIFGDVKKSYSIAYAPQEMSIDECKQNGYKLIIDDEPQHLPNHIAMPDHVEEDEESFRIIYVQVEIPYVEPVFKYSKYKLIAELMKRGIWASCKQMIEDNDLYDLFNAAQELKSDDEFFKQGIQLAKTQLSSSDETIQEVLSASIVD